FLPCLDGPYLHRPVHPPDSEPMAVGAECHAPYARGSSLAGESGVPGLGLPHAHRPVLTFGGKPPAIGAERQIPPDAAVPPVASEAFPPGPRVPHLHREALPRGEEPMAVGAERHRHAHDRTGLPAESEVFLAGSDVRYRLRPVEIDH